MDDYFCAKAKILDVLKNTGKLIVIKDHREIWMKINSNKLQIIDTARRNLPIKFDTNFNQENISLALAVVANLGKDTRLIKLDMIPAVPGRFNLEHIDNKIVIIDFAHTPDALENVLKQIREDYVGKKLITVFGCGGDRDRSKRPIMGQIAANFSDEVIVTSDNPRGENPLQIIEDIVSGIKNQKPYYKIENRIEAIKLALSQSINTDIVLIAGKGHETTMNYAGKLIEHNDYDVVKKIREKLI
jgi:UDP-N-acetylmuramoyl-L-alanyl-D-glutamate--2,6-diaminopimelate ligase